MPWIKMESCTGATGGGQCSCRNEQNSDVANIMRNKTQNEVTNNTVITGTIPTEVSTYGFGGMWILLTKDWSTGKTGYAFGLYGFDKSGNGNTPGVIANNTGMSVASELISGTQIKITVSVKTSYLRLIMI